MKNVLFVAHDDAGQEARMQCALDVVRAIGGHLNCIDVTVLPVVASDFIGDFGQLAEIDNAIKAERANRATLEPKLWAEGVPYSWVDVTGNVVSAIAGHLHLNDLVVVGSHGDKEDGRPLDGASEIVASAGRPVLAVPHEADALNLFGTAMVAWDGSDPAEASLRAAIPLLKLAERVLIVSVSHDEGSTSNEDAAVYCNRHGVNAAIENLPRGYDKTYRTLLEYARAERVNWIAMGAFGHSRFRESFFGGVTRAMLGHAPIPLFLCG